MITQAVILCGGRGLRLMPVTSTLPKPLIPIGGKPILEHQIAELKKYGVTDLVLCTGYMAKAIEFHFGDGRRYGVSISYSLEEKPLGTAGAVCNISRDLDENFFVIYGDVFFRVNLEKLATSHVVKNAAATLVIHESGHPEDSDVAEIDADGRITNFNRRRVNEGETVLSNAAFLVLNRSFLSLIPPNEKLDFSLDVFPQAVKKTPCFGYVTDEYIFDVGTKERYDGLLAEYEVRFK